ncbi:glucose 1,6-bisphosphate synthase isoform X2 [Gouania willdenowi]|uniref:glucose 1,6-bisphosphate synthase isoform X2 n=1 Tax=Gouania willdenowi TaxID=441366 RepID=UPI001055FF0E|nr:glucose 1,6-bisphosphate synthase isoform X2 [Gouania willdenowi]
MLSSAGVYVCATDTHSTDTSTDPKEPQLSGLRAADCELEAAVQRWMNWDRNPFTRAQIQSLVSRGLYDDLRSRLLSRLSFGTAGLRAPMGAGFNRINDLTVIQTTQGLYSYLNRCVSDLRIKGVVVGFDVRAQEESGCSSSRLAALTSSVLLSRDVPVHLFSSYVPTPFVPYAVKKLRAAAGVMITASHNMKEDNGYKVYWSNGAQVLAPHDKQVLQSVEEELQPWGALCWDHELVQRSPLRTDPIHQISRCYMEQLSSLCFHKALNSICPLKIVHSSFHGVGHVFVQDTFREFGFTPPIPVPQQKEPDPAFPTVHCPNPEEGHSVLKLSLQLAESEGATIVLATDPDADRLAVAERVDGWTVFSGNQVAALLGWWMFFNWKHTHPNVEPNNVYMLATCVSSRILQTMASTEGFNYQETLPGFKWIGNKIHDLCEEGHEVLFSFEESIGFLCGSWVPEKDGVSSAAVVAEMCSFLHHRKSTLTQQLLHIYHMYGCHVTRTSYVTCRDPPTIQRIFSRLRCFPATSSYPCSVGGVPIIAVRDINTGYDSSQSDGRSILPVAKSGHMITFTLQNGAVATLRTSGTEPKIKFYTELRGAPGESDASLLEEELNKVTAALLEDFLEPKKNKLILRTP